MYNTHKTDITKQELQTVTQLKDIIRNPQRPQLYQQTLIHDR